MILCFAVFLAAVAVTLLTGHSLIWALLLGLCLFFLLGLHSGYSAGALVGMAWQRGKESLIVVPVFLLIGIVMGLWRSCGTISFFLYHGLSGLAPHWFVLTAFFLSAILSFAIGTSFGVCGTAGVVLMTLANGGGVSVAVTAGAVLSGAYFGDRCSPMSSCASLVAACTGTELYRNVREMLKTGALPTVLAVAFYGVLSVRNPIAQVDEAVLSTLRTQVSLAWPVILPAVLMLALPLLRVSVKWAMAASAVAALVLTVALQGIPVLSALKIAVLGYAPADPLMAKILSGGGLISMLTSSAIVFITSLYSGILEGTKALTPAKQWSERLAGKVGLFPATAIVSVLVVMVFCNQSVMVIMDEQLLGESYRRRRASPLEQAMDIANSGVTLAGMIPWSIALSIPLTMLGAELTAAPYAVLMYLIPLCYLLTRRYFAPAQRGTMPAEELSDGRDEPS